MVPDLQYNYHDATLIGIKLIGDMLELQIHLYPLFYPDDIFLHLHFLKVLNLDKAAQFVQDVDDEADNEWLGARIESLHFCDKRNSAEKNLYIYLKIEQDWVRIHCKDILIETMDCVSIAKALKDSN